MLRACEENPSPNPSPKRRGGQNRPSGPPLRFGEGLGEGFSSQPLTRCLPALAACLLLACAAQADDWPQYRGPQRDGISKETGLLKTWPTGGPALAWTFTNAGEGYSGPAVAGERVYLMGTRDGTEYLFA